MLTITLLLPVAAFVVIILAAMGKAPLWIAVPLICIAALLAVLPLR